MNSVFPRRFNSTLYQFAIPLAMTVRHRRAEFTRIEQPVEHTWYLFWLVGEFKICIRVPVCFSVLLWNKTRIANTLFRLNIQSGYFGFKHDVFRWRSCDWFNWGCAPLVLSVSWFQCFSREFNRYTCAFMDMLLQTIAESSSARLLVNEFETNNIRSVSKQPSFKWCFSVTIFHN